MFVRGKRYNQIAWRVSQDIPKYAAVCDPSIRSAVAHAFTSEWSKNSRSLSWRTPKVRRTIKRCEGLQIVAKPEVDVHGPSVGFGLKKPFVSIASYSLYLRGRPKNFQLCQLFQQHMSRMSQPFGSPKAPSSGRPRDDPRDAPVALAPHGHASRGIQCHAARQ